MAFLYIKSQKKYQTIIIVKSVHLNFLYYKISVRQSFFFTDYKCTTKVATRDHLKRKFVPQYDETFQNFLKVYDMVLNIIFQGPL